MPQHVKELKGLAKARDFSQYFRTEALVNRPARKLFEAWLRKDETLWTRLYHTIHKEMTITEGDGDAEETKKPAAKAAKAKETVVSPPKAAKAEKPAATAKAAVKEAPKAKAKAKDADEKPAKAKPAAKAKAKDDKPAKAKADVKKAKPAPKKK